MNSLDLTFEFSTNSSDNSFDESLGLNACSISASLSFNHTTVVETISKALKRALNKKKS
jgi:hypothetical protein